MGLGKALPIIGNVRSGIGVARYIGDARHDLAELIGGERFAHFDDKLNPALQVSNVIDGDSNSTHDKATWGSFVKNSYNGVIEGLGIPFSPAAVSVARHLPGLHEIDEKINDLAPDAKELAENDGIEAAGPAKDQFIDQYKQSLGYGVPAMSTQQPAGFNLDNYVAPTPQAEDTGLSL